MLTMVLGSCIMAPSEAMEKRMNNFYKIKSSHIDTLTMSGTLSHNALRVFCLLGNQVTDGNKASIDTKDIVAFFKFDKAMVSKVLKELEDGLLIKIEHKEGSDRVIAVNPTYWWLGDYSLQGGATKRWYADVRKKHWGSVVKETKVFLDEQK
mgnify:CR=1 FL=1